MSENTKTQEKKVIEVDVNTTPIKAFWNKHKKTLITIAVTAASTTLALKWVNRESDDYDYEDEDEVTED